jgi:hypothetical protein
MHFWYISHCANSVWCFLSIITMETVQTPFFLNGDLQNSKLCFLVHSEWDPSGSYVYTTNREFPKLDHSHCSVLQKWHDVTTAVWKFMHNDHGSFLHKI